MSLWKWESVNTGLPVGLPSVLNFTLDSGFVYAATTEGVFKTLADGNLEWLATNNIDFVDPCTYAIIGKSSIQLAATQNGIYRTTDQGASWVVANTGLPENTIGYTFTKTKSPGPICFAFVGTDNGVYKTTSNSWDAWTAVNTGLTNLSIRSLNVYGSGIFAGTSGGGIFVTTNLGASWTEVNTGLTNLYINALTSGGTGIIVAGSDNGVIFSSTDGSTWTTVSSGYGSIRALEYYDYKIHAGTDAGLFIGSNNGDFIAETGASNRTNAVVHVGKLILLAGEAQPFGILKGVSN